MKISKSNILPEALESIVFHDTLDSNASNVSWAPLRVQRISDICNHPNIYWNGGFLESNPAQIQIMYNPQKITRNEVDDFMCSRGFSVEK